MATVLIVEDEKENRQLYTHIVTSAIKKLEMGYLPILEATTFEEAQDILGRLKHDPTQEPLLILLDMELPSQFGKIRFAGYKLMSRYRQNFAKTLWIPLTATVDLINEREHPGQPSIFEELYALQPFDVLEKGKLKEMETIVYKALKSIQELPDNKTQRGNLLLPETTICFQDPSSQKQLFYVMQSYDLFRQIRMIADTQRNVLLFGEPGTGKTLTAQLIHYYSNLRNERFVAVDGQLKDLESSLFPTSRSELPDDDQHSYLGQAHNGILYIANFDQMGGAGQDTAYRLQGRLLHFIRYRGYNVRIIGGIARPRLNFSLNENILPAFLKTTMFLELLSLQDRKHNIPDLIHLFVQQFNQEHEELPSSVAHPWQIDEEPKILVDEERIHELLHKQNWQNGNISQLRELIDEVLLSTSTPVVTVDDFTHILHIYGLFPSINTVMPLYPDSQKGENNEETEATQIKRVKPPVVITIDDLRRLGLHG